MFDDLVLGGRFFALMQLPPLFTDFEISNKKILFEDVARKGVKTQIPFTSHPFVILGTKRLDCTHGVDRNKSKKKKNLDNRIKKVSLYILTSLILSTGGWYRTLYYMWYAVIHSIFCQIRRSFFSYEFYVK